MAGRRDLGTLVEVAKMYYLDGINQSRIAKTLGISTSSVSRMLNQARETGLVTVAINDPREGVGRREDLEEALAARFCLESAYVAAHRPGVAPMDLVARLAAEVVNGRLSQVSSIGLSWGRTVSAFAHCFERPRSMTPLDIYPLSGGMSVKDSDVSGNASVQALARRCGGKAHRIDAPVIVSSAQVCAAMLAEPIVLEALRDAASCELAVVGIGSMGVHWSATLSLASVLSPAEMAEVRAAGIAGDVCGRTLNDDGEAVRTSVDDHLIGLTLDELRDIPEVIGIAAGAEKSRGVAGILRSGIVQSVVVDEQLADVVLST